MSKSIVVLDGYTLNPGDLSWDGLKKLGPCEIHERTPAAQILERSKNAKLVLTNKVPFSRETIQQLPQLEYIGVLATGFNIIDVDACKERKITVTNVPGYGTESVAQTVFALLLELTHRAGAHSEAVHKGRWSSNPDWCFWDQPLVELAGKTFGIVGHGKIGSAVARIARGFNMKVLIATRTPKQSSDPNLRYTSVDELFRESDVISLHCPLTPETKELVNAARLSSMKSTAFLINTGRGPLIDERALRNALDEGKIAGAGLDVLSQEPPSKDHPLIGAPRAIITPHYAWGTASARARLLQIVIENIQAYLAGSPKNVVNA
jgi:glycerate dehydrogenase